MKNQPLFISIMFGITIFLASTFLLAVIYNFFIKKTRAAKENPDEWLFHNFREKLYSAFFGKMDPDILALKLGIKIEDYYNNCKIVRKEPNVKKLIINFISGFTFFVITLIFAVLFNPLFILLGFIVFFSLSSIDISSTKSKASEMKAIITAETPKFFDLLQTELEIGLPINRSIEVLSIKYDSLLSREFLEALNDVKLGGAGGWQRAIEKVAEKYNIDILSDLVMDMCIAYDKGISVAQAVKAKTKDVKQKMLFSAKEKAGITENTILFPIAFFQFIPMLAYVLLPTLASVSNF